MTSSVKYLIFLGLIVGLGLGVYFHQAEPTARHQPSAVQPAIDQVASEAPFGSLSVGEFEAAMQELEPIVIDIRTVEEYGLGHLPGAINIDYYRPDFRQSLTELDSDQAYAIYCRSGRRSRAALELMKELGFERVIELAGGLEAWAAAGQKVCLDC